MLRDGRLAGTVETRCATRDEAVRLIVGRVLPVERRAGRLAVAQAIMVEAISVSGPLIDQLSFHIGRGEIVGVTGLLGSGHEALPYLLYGGKRAGSGTLVIEGRRHELSDFTSAAAIAHGIVLIPGDRANAGAIGALPVVDNVTMPLLGTRFRSPWVGRGRMLREAAALGRRFDVTPNRPTLPLSALSGGNARKVILAKWLQADPKLILLDEPTQGVDVGARVKVFEAIRAAAARGAAVLCASSDYEQLAAICNRVLILARGRVAAELDGETLSKAAIAESCYRSSAAVTRDVAPVA